MHDEPIDGAGRPAVNGKKKATCSTPVSSNASASSVNSPPPIHDQNGHPTWYLKAAAKREARETLIPAGWWLPQALLEALPSNVRPVPASCAVLSALELAITEEDDARALVGRMASGELSAVDVCRAYCKRAAIAQQLTNCLTEIMFDSAMERATQLDAHFARTGELIGPLHGLPISVKDQFDVAGFDSTMGFVSLIGKPAGQHSVLVDLLLALGAVVHCKTNVPQTLMVDETTNHVFGPTVNPCNRRLTAGGSSGGEGALVALKGSIIGVGTDWGGSIRKPAAYCGLYSLRPTSRRLPYEGAANVFKGLEGVESVLGPMARSTSSVELFMRVLVGSKPWELDSHTVERPWMPDGDLAQRKLRVCIVRDNGIARNHPPVVRALEEVASALIAAGHEVTNCPPLEFDFSRRMMSKMATADGGLDIKAFLEASGEPLIREAFSPLPPSTPPSVFEYHQLVQERDAFRQRFLATWRATAGLFAACQPMDLILCAVAPHLAPPFLGAPRPAELIVDTGIFSLLDLPAGTMPAGAIDPARDVIDRSLPTDSLSKNPADRHHWKSYDPERFADAPTAVQLVSPRRFREDDLLTMMRVVEEALFAQRQYS